jgi:hypothetical protein
MAQFKQPPVYIYLKVNHISKLQTNKSKSIEKA